MKMNNSLLWVNMKDVSNKPVVLSYEESTYSKNGQSAPLEDVQIRVWINNKISNKRFFIFNVSSTSWASWDTTPRKVKLVWYNNDVARSLTTEIVTWIWNTTFTVSKRSTMDTPANSEFIVPSMWVLEISTAFTTTTQTLTVVTSWWTLSYLLGSSLALTPSNPSIIITNTSYNRMTVSFNFSTSASERPNFWLFLQSL